MKRRKALQRLGLGLSAGLVMPQYLISCKKDDPGPEVPFDGTVAIIGAGAAGLYAADILRAKGVKVIVLEASSQAGGRIKSLRNQTNIPSQSIADFPVELGAEIISGSDSIWGNIIKNLSVPTVDLGSATNQFIIDKLSKSEVDWAGDADFNAVKNFVSAIPNFSGAGATMKSAAGVSERAQALLNSQAGNYYGSSSDKVGANGIAEGLRLLQHDNKLLTMKANPMQDLLLSRFNLVVPEVKLNTPVKSINYGGDPIIITDKSGNTFEVNKVIVTVPLAVLKSGGISFSPALPGEMTSSFGKFGMDASIRVVLDFKKNFWGESTGFIWGGTEGPQYFNAGVGRSEFNRTLSITINGPKATELSALGADLVPKLIEELDSVYSNQATLYIRRDLATNQILSIVQDWSKEEYIKGGVSYPLTNGTNADRVSLGKPINGKLFFAGEATDVVGDAGTINGALNSAERVTEEVVKSILGV